MPQFLIGTSGWNYPAWRRRFYPKACPQRQWLEHYATLFNTVEINATFYRFFKPDIFQKWYDEVPANFRFVLKTHRFITHHHLLLHTDELIQSFTDSIKPLGKKLALILLQLAYRTGYDLERLEHAVRAFPNRKKVVVEFRNPKWLTPEVRELLEKLGCVYCAVDSPEISLNNWVTSDKAYIRLHGRKRWYNYNYTEKELKEIARFAKQVGKKAKQVYIYFNNDYYAYSVKNALRLKELLE